jgi:hypothetical protein
MNEDRISTFTAEVGELKLSAAKGDRERWLLILGIVSMIVGVGLAILGGMQASGASDPADQWAFIATGSLIGITLTVAGAALFVRYSVAKFMRFWLVRLVHEHRSETDRVVAALTSIESRLGPPQA